MREQHTPRIAIFGATGSLGSHVARLAVAAGHDVSVLVRAPDRLAPDFASKATITTGDLMQQPPSQLGAFISGHDVLISCAGLVTEGQRFVDLFDRAVSSVEALPESDRPLCWLLAGAGLLDLDSSGRRGLDLPKVRDMYWPHRAVGIRRLRVSFERLPVAMPAVTKLLPDPLVQPLFATKIPQMIIPYADAAAFMLANLDRGGPMYRKRVGLALPHGMTGHKGVPSARAPGASTRATLERSWATHQEVLYGPAASHFGKSPMDPPWAGGHPGGSRRPVGFRAPPCASSGAGAGSPGERHVRGRLCHQLFAVSKRLAGHAGRRFLVRSGINEIGHAARDAAAAKTGQVVPFFAPSRPLVCPPVPLGCPRNY